MISNCLQKDQTKRPIASVLLKHALLIQNSDDVLMFRENILKDDQWVPAEGPDKEIHGLGATEAQLVHLNSDDVLMFRENIPKDDQRVPAVF